MFELKICFFSYRNSPHIMPLSKTVCHSCRHLDQQWATTFSLKLSFFSMSDSRFLCLGHVPKRCYRSIQAHSYMCEQRGKWHTENLQTHKHSYNGTMVLKAPKILQLDPKVLTDTVSQNSLLRLHKLRVAITSGRAGFTFGRW